MPKTALTVAFEIPTTSMSRVQDVMVEIKKAVDDHKGMNFFVTIQGPIADNYEAKENGKRTEDSEEHSERRSMDGRGTGSGTGGDDGSDGDDKPKRGRGRPRKSDAGSSEASGSASGKRQRSDEDGDGSEGTDGNESVRTRKGSDEGSGQGEGRSGGSGRGGSSERGNRQASRVKDDEGDDWGDEDGGDNFEEDDPEEVAAKSSKEWPDSLTPDERDIDKPYITKLLGDHYNASGGKDRTLTFDVMEDATGTRKLAEIDEQDYVKLAKALLKDIARYKYGIKKAK